MLDRLLLASQRSSLHWPSHWRNVIFRITRVPMADDHRFVATPFNPDYVQYLKSGHEFLMGRSRTDPSSPPVMTGEPVTFDSIQEMDAWARVVDRLTNQEQQSPWHTSQ